MWMLGLAAVLQAACGDDPTQPDTVTRYPGSASSLQAAIDLAGVGETVLVGPGTHTIDAPVVVAAARANITLLGDTSQGSRPILQFALAATADAIYVNASGFRIAELEIAGTYRDGVTFSAGGCVLSHCVVRDASRDAVVYKGPAGDGRIEANLLLDAARFGVTAIDGADATVERNTIAGAGDCGIYTYEAAPNLVRNIIVRSANIGVACFLSPVPALSCNALFQNTNSDYLGCTGPTDIHADPKFCSETAYTLMPDSPCAQVNAGSCGQMGAGNVCAGP
jgi:hypothetical protein